MKKLTDLKIGVSRVIILCLIVAVLTAGIVVATSPTQPFTINRGVYPGAPSFTVWEEDGTYFAKNQYGVLAYSGTDAATVINEAFNGLTVGRTWKEKVVLNGDLGTVHDILVPSNTIIEGIGAKLTLPAVNTFIFGGAAAGITNIEIKNIDFYAVRPGRSTDPIAIDLSATGGEVVSHVKVQDSSFYDFSWDESSTPAGVRGAYDDLEISGCLFDTPMYEPSYGGGYLGAGDIGYPIYLADPCTDVRVFNNRFNIGVSGNALLAYKTTGLKAWGNHFSGTDNRAIIELLCWEGLQDSEIFGNTFENGSADGIYGVSDARQTFNVGIHGNNFVDCAQQTGAWHRAAISVEASDTYNSMDIRIINNGIRNCGGNLRIGVATATKDVQALIEDNTVKDGLYPFVFYSGYTVQLKNNRFLGTFDNPAYFEEVGTLKASGNEGFVTENSGTASVETGATVNHGLAGTPTLVTVTAAESGPTDIYVSDVGASTFKINFGGGGTKQFYWYAEYQP